jgi:AraC family transcriptional regulator
LARLVNIERVIEGRLQRERFLPGNVAIYPAEVDYILRWEQESEFLLLGIDPTLLARTAAEVLDQETIKLIPLLVSLGQIWWQWFRT